MTATRSEPLPTGETPASQARQWWKSQVEGDCYVVSPTEAPSAAAARVLRHDGLVYEVAGRRAWILTPAKPTDGRALFLANYWNVVSLVLKHYEPAVIIGHDAVRLYLGNWTPPTELRVNQGANQSAYTLTLDAEFQLRLRPRDVPSMRIARLGSPRGADIPTLTAAALLLTLDEPELVTGIEPVSAWLRHLALREAELTEAVEDAPRPVILQRLADLAGALGNASLERMLDAAARRVSPHPAPPARTGVGTRIIVPQPLGGARPGSGSPWIDAQTMRLARQEAEVATIIGPSGTELPTFATPRLIANAQQSKALDAYHSTTMEGYRISPEVAEAIVRGEPLPEGPQDRQAMEAAMAVKGYSSAFDVVLNLAASRAPVTASVILDLYEALYRPSVEAGIVGAHELHRWRNAPVGLHGWRHIPPNPAKIDDLIGGLERFAARPELPPVARALLVPLEFVTIHPFFDGNGRLGRLLMNLALLSAGYPWVTVRADERIPFFQAIERAQVDDDTATFIRFLWHLIHRNARELELASRVGGTRRR